MRRTEGTNTLPKLVVCQTDHERLLALALAANERLQDVADELLAEMDRARIVADTAVPPTAVRMGSRIEFTADGGERRCVTLVYPAEADIASGKISVMTPIGAALIGLSEGQSITWTTRDGRQQRLTVHAVSPPGCSRIAV